MAEMLYAPNKYLYPPTGKTLPVVGHSLPLLFPFTSISFSPDPPAARLLPPEIHPSLCSPSLSCLRILLLSRLQRGSEAAAGHASRAVRAQGLRLHLPSVSRVLVDPLAAAAPCSSSPSGAAASSSGSLPASIASGPRGSAPTVLGPFTSTRGFSWIRTGVQCPRRRRSRTPTLAVAAYRRRAPPGGSLLLASPVDPSTCRGVGRAPWLAVKLFQIRLADERPWCRSLPAGLPAWLSAIVVLGLQTPSKNLNTAIYAPAPCCLLREYR